MFVTGTMHLMSRKEYETSASDVLYPELPNISRGFGVSPFAEAELGEICVIPLHRDPRPSHQDSSFDHALAKPQAQPLRSDLSLQQWVLRYSY